MSDKYVFTRMMWMLNPTEAVLQFTKLSSNATINFHLKVGDEINLKFFDKRYCIGSEIGQGNIIGCIDNHARNLRDSTMQKEVNPKYNQCSLCRSSSFFECRKICIGEECNPSSLLAKSICDPPQTSVYLTHVGGQVKIGVSLGVKRRWIEQGSDYAVEVAVLPGLTARKLEQLTSKRLDVKLQVRNTQKIQSISNPPENAVQELEHTFSEMKPIALDVLEDSKGSIIHELTIHNFDHIYGTEEINQAIELVDPLSGTEFGGRIVRIKGSLIIVKQGLYYYAVDTKRMMSRLFEILDRPAKMEGQSSLVEWFK